MNKMAKGQPKRDSKGRFIKGIVPINKIKLPYNELKKLYKSFGASMIAKKYNISKSTVLRNLHDYNIPMRKKGSPEKLPEYWIKALQKPKKGIPWNKGQTKETNKNVMSISKKLRREKNYNWRSEIHKREKVECACGCGELLNKYDKKGRRRYYITGHCGKGHFTTERVSGANNNNWKGGITGENEKIRRSDKYNKWRDDIYKRDNYKCQICGSKKDIVAHHIKEFAEYPELRFDINNGITVCRSCHYKIHRRKEIELCQTEMEKDQDQEVQDQVGLVEV
jgi:hypothetical protein